jgi:hypothetical protein
MRPAWPLPLVPGLAVLLLLAGCTGPSYPVSGPVAAPPVVGPPTASARLETPLPRSAGRAKECGAAELQGLIGRPRTEVPVPLDPSRQRVACTTCPTADNVDPSRLNFLFDAESGLIKVIRCG